MPLILLMTFGVAVSTSTILPYGTEFGQNRQKPTLPLKAVGFQSGNEALVNTITYSSQQTPEICSIENGSFVIAWQNTTDGDAQGINIKIFNSTGHDQTDDIRANSNITDAQSDPDLCGLDNGSFVVTWCSGGQDGDGAGIFLKIFNSTGHNQTDDIQVNSYTTGNQVQPTVCKYQNETFLVAWTCNTQSKVFVKQFNYTGHNQTDDIQVSSYAGGSQEQPDIAVLSNGNFVVTWESWLEDGSGDGVFLRIFNSTLQNQTNDIQVNGYTDNNQMRPSITCLSSNESFVVAWDSMGQDGDLTGVYLKIFDYSGQNQTDEIQINSYTTSYQAIVVLDSFSDDTFIATWESNGQDGGDSGVFMRYFNAAGQNLTNEVQVNIHTPSSQGSPSVAVILNDTFVVTWDSYGQVEDGSDIFFRMFTVDHVPTSNSPAPIVTSKYGQETINWTLLDDFGSSHYRVWANDTSGNPYVLWDWQPWQNNTNLLVQINRTAPGIFNYTIEYNDSTGQLGIPNTVFITIIDAIPTCDESSDISIRVGAEVSISWVLYDDYGEGFYRIWADTSGTLQPITDWNQWSNGSTIQISVNTETAGTFHYRIEFNDSAGQQGTSDDIIVTIQADPTSPPVPGFEVLYLILGLVVITGFVWHYRKRKHQ